MSRLVSALIVSLLLGLAGSAHAAPLTTLQLDALDQYLAREGACLLLPAHARPACRASMFQELGISAADAAWEKDGLAGITPQDQLLALAEYWDEGTRAYICYGDAPANSVVRFVESCGRDQCVEHLRAACQAGCSAPPCACAPESFADECADADGDGLFAYQEQELGLRDDHHDTCSSHADCGFQGECKYLEGERAFHVRPICQERACAGGTCTAFHLELVSEDADELIVQVHFDYAPEPLSVLDLYVEFDPAVLKLAEARPLATLRSAQHELKARQVAEGRLRLVVFGTNDKRPIEQGAIAELVFERRTGA